MFRIEDWKNKYLESDETKQKLEEECQILQEELKALQVNSI